MKKVVIEVFVLIVIAVVSSIIIYNKYGNTKKIILSDDEIMFKKEYEDLNGTKDKNGKKYNMVLIKEDNGVIYTNTEDLNKVIANDSVIYIGNPEDIKSRSVVSVILDSADSTGVEDIYYLNTNNISEKEMEKLLKTLNIEDLDIPCVLFAVDGEIIGMHLGTIEDKEVLNDKDKNELAKIYMQYMAQVSSGVCDDKC